MRAQVSGSVENLGSSTAPNCGCPPGRTGRLPGADHLRFGRKCRGAVLPGHFYRAQVSVDFIIASLVVMSLFSIVFGLYITKSRGVGEVMSSLEAQRLGDRIAWNINEVSRAGDGARAEVFIPNAIWGEQYYVSVEGRWTEVVWNHGGSENHLSVPLMTNNTRGGIFNPNTRLEIKNEGGIVEIS